MNRYKFASVSYQYSLTMRSTDAHILKSIFVELAKMLPLARQDEHKLASGEVYAYTVSKVETEDLVAAEWWIMQQLCQAGWEPFSVEAGKDTNVPDNHVYYFRIQG